MSPARSERPVRVIVASASVGAGHNQAGVAVVESLRRAGPAIEAEFLDALEFVPAWFRLVYAGGYTLSVTRFPRLYGVGYALADAATGPGRDPGERLRLRVERRATAAFQHRVLGRRPVLVVATHYLVMPVVGWMIGRGVGGIRLWAVITDNEAHRFWYAENVERYFVANDRVAGQLGAWDVDGQRVTVTGIPVHPKWTDPVDAGQVRRRWRLPGGVPIVLASGGAYFTVGPIGRIVGGILSQTPAHVVVLAGSNKRLAAEVSSLPGAAGRVTAVPFTDRLHELAELADVMVTKPGGLTTAECLAKGTPMVLTDPVPGQEAANADLLVRAGAAVMARRPGEVVSAVAGLLARPERLARLRAHAAGLYRPAAATIARQIIEAVARGS